MAFHAGRGDAVFFALIGNHVELHEHWRPGVTYAMGKDDEAPEARWHLHAGSLSPRRAIWTLAVISAVVGLVAVSFVFADATAPSQMRHHRKALRAWNIFSSFGYTSHDKLAALPNSLLTIAPSLRTL